MVFSEPPSNATETPITTTLYSLLSNPLLLRHTAPYIPVTYLLHLAATNKQFRGLILHTPGVFRHLDLAPVKSARFEIEGIDHGGETWRNVQLDENLTEDDFYSGPLRGVFSHLRRRNLLGDVQTLILDTLAVTAELCHEIITDSSYNVKILSLRNSKHLNESQLRGALQYACRSSRPEGAPRLKGLYIFTTPESNLANLTATNGAAAATIGADWNQKSHQALQRSLEDSDQGWYGKCGRLITRAIADDWSTTLQACEGIISFDAVLCRGPRHVNSPAYGKYATATAGSQRLLSVATYALDTCAGCGTAPEGRIVHGDSATSLLPLLTPPPVLSSTIRAATQPRASSRGRPYFVARCAECLRDRYCASCHRWWCEACYQLPGISSHGGFAEGLMMTPPYGVGGTEQVDASPKPKARVSKSCWECGFNCGDCIDMTQRHCRGCRGGYCIIHNEGSTHVFCDWCSSRGRVIRSHY